MYKYKLYDLVVSSSVAFSFLNTTSNQNQADIVITESLPPPSGTIKYKDNILIDISESFIYRKNIGFFKISQGKKITFYREDHSVSDALIARSIINAIFGFCLYQRGLFVLHASAVDINNKSFIFTGPSGIGKSSLAACLVTKYNANLVCEDVACLDSIDDGYSIRYAPPFIKLSNEIAKLLNFEERDGLKLPADRLDRLLYLIARKKRKNYLNACFFLDWGESFSIKEIKPNEVLPSFFISTYTAFPFNKCKQSSEMFHNHVINLYKNVPIFRVIRPRDELLKSADRIMDFLYKY